MIGASENLFLSSEKTDAILGDQMMTCLVGVKAVSGTAMGLKFRMNHQKKIANPRKH